MEICKQERPSRTVLRAEIEAMNHFLIFADDIRPQLKRKSRIALDDKQRSAVQLVAGRLTREIKRRAAGGRPQQLSDETVKLIADQIEHKANQWSVKAEVRQRGIKSISSLCALYDTNYKSFWRRFNESGGRGFDLPEKELSKLDVLIRLAGDQPVGGKKDAEDFAALYDAVLNYHWRVRATNQPFRITARS